MVSRLFLQISSLSFFILLCNVIVTVDGQVNYTAQERHVLQKFRAATTDILGLDYQQLDSFLIRWLRTKNLDVAAATDMIRSSMRWRAENKIDGILNETLFHFNPKVYSIDGVDFEGRPVITFDPTTIDLRRFVLQGDGQKLSRYWDQILEEGERKLLEASLASGGAVNQGISIMDLQRFNPRQHICLGCISVFLDWVTHYERHHPDMAKHIVWINAPRVFIPVLEIIKPFLAPASAKALKVFPANRKEWSSYLLKLIPADQLTTQFGGTKKV